MKLKKVQRNNNRGTVKSVKGFGTTLSPDTSGLGSDRAQSEVQKIFEDSFPKYFDHYTPEVQSPPFLESNGYQPSSLYQMPQVSSPDDTGQWVVSLQQSNVGDFIYRNTVAPPALPTVGYSGSNFEYSGQHHVQFSAPYETAHHATK